MPIGVFRVGLLSREDEPAQGNEGGAYVAQVVEPVGLDGQGADQRPQNDLEAAEDQVEHDAHAAADHAVAVPHSLLVRIVMKKKPRQKSDHTASSFERSWFKV